MTAKIIWGALAMSYAWGIRGTIAGAMRGAMFAGAILGLSIARVSVQPDVQAAYLLLTAAGAIGVSFGGCMTYGQTLGLTHDGDPPPNYWWGILGTAVKGSVWIGLGALLMAMVAGPVDYGWHEWCLLVGGGYLIWALGIKVFNRPLDPPHRFPRIYFSARSADGRMEYWGGMWALFLGLLVYSLVLRHDRFAASMAAFGLLGGLGFPIGQMLQAWGRRKIPFGREVQPRIDWWKVMEFTFGAIAGALVVGGWLYLESSVERVMPALWQRGPFNQTILNLPFLLWMVGVLTEQRWGPSKDPERTWWFLTMYLVLPLLGVTRGSLLWTGWAAAPLIFWVVGITVPRRWQNIPGRAVVYVLILATVACAAIMSTYDLLTAPILWRTLIIYHLLLVFINEWRRTYSEFPSLKKQKGLATAILAGLGANNPVNWIFILQAFVLVFWQP